MGGFRLNFPAYQGIAFPNRRRHNQPIDARRIDRPAAPLTPRRLNAAAVCGGTHNGMYLIKLCTSRTHKRPGCRCRCRCRRCRRRRLRRRQRSNGIPGIRHAHCMYYLNHIKSCACGRHFVTHPLGGEGETGELTDKRCRCSRGGVRHQQPEITALPVASVAHKTHPTTTPAQSAIE